MDDRKIIYLGMPSTGEMTLNASIGFHRCTKRKSHHVELLALASSLATGNFNKLWCWALNGARKGRVDYFAMIHSDVEPPEFWLDVLIDELEEKKLDVLGVVAPIKDPRGLTSIAIAHPDGSPWYQTRLTMQEVYKLPETFTSDNVGGPLLINTGLWVCKFDMRWAPNLYFTVNDRISIAPDGDYVPEIEPEDWFSSRLYHELGLKVGCTRKIPLHHRGTMAFSNTHPWGNYKWDKEWTHKSFLDYLPPCDWFPHNVAGWLTEEEGRELSELAANKDVFEIGAYCGRSTICLAQKAKTVSVVDTFDGRGTALQGSTHELFLKNLRRAGVRDKVVDYVGTSEDYLPNFPPVYDLVFIDGSHDRESVAKDIELACAILKPYGVLVFHDYAQPQDPEVTEVVDEFLANGAELVSRCGSLAVVRPLRAEILVEELNHA